MTVRTPHSAEALGRSALSAATHTDMSPAPIRIVHMGLGAFHRAHQAWYTAQAPDAADWGIAAFTGRSSAAAEILSSQDGLYTLIERSADGDAATIVPSIVEAVDGANLARFLELLAAPTTAVVTLTITEAGYRLKPDGTLDLKDPEIVADLKLFAKERQPAVQTALARLVLGLRARHRAGAGALAVVPCDNLPANGLALRGAILALARRVDPATAGWIADSVSFVSTSVDRITPRSTAADELVVTDTTGWIDRAPVVTEPFTDWVLAGGFPAGRPAWDSVGARFVDDIEPFERRKLWLLNGAHSLLAYLGQLRGHCTVAEAISDPGCRARVEEFWDEAERHLLSATLDLAAYRVALLARFGNPRIEHALNQIATDGIAKLRVRIVPVARAERAEGRAGLASAVVVAAWISVVRNGISGVDTQSAAIVEARARGRDEVSALVTLLDAGLGADAVFLASVKSCLLTLS